MPTKLSIFEAIEALPRAILLFCGGKWGITLNEGASFADVCQHDHIQEAIHSFCGYWPDATEKDDVVLGYLSSNFTKLAAEWWPEKSAGRAGWFRPLPTVSESDLETIEKAALHFSG